MRTNSRAILTLGIYGLIQVSPGNAGTRNAIQENISQRSLQEQRLPEEYRVVRENSLCREVEGIHYGERHLLFSSPSGLRTSYVDGDGDGEIDAEMSARLEKVGDAVIFHPDAPRPSSGRINDIWKRDCEPSKDILNDTNP